VWIVWDDTTLKKHSLICRDSYGRRGANTRSGPESGRTRHKSRQDNKKERNPRKESDQEQDGSQKKRKSQDKKKGKSDDDKKKTSGQQGARTSQWKEVKKVPVSPNRIPYDKVDSLEPKGPATHQTVVRLKKGAGSKRFVKSAEPGVDHLKVSRRVNGKPSRWASVAYHEDPNRRRRLEVNRQYVKFDRIFRRPNGSIWVLYGPYQEDARHRWALVRHTEPQQTESDPSDSRKEDPEPTSDQDQKGGDSPKKGSDEVDSPDRALPLRPEGERPSENEQGLKVTICYRHPEGRGYIYDRGIPKSEFSDQDVPANGYTSLPYRNEEETITIDGAEYKRWQLFPDGDKLHLIQGKIERTFDRSKVQS